VIIRAMAANGSVAVRPWQARDYEAVQGLLKLLSRGAVIRSECAPTYVAEMDGRVIGMVTLCVFETLTGRKAYLDHLVVAVGMRRRGVGGALVRHAVEQARTAGALRVDLTANSQKDWTSYDGSLSLFLTTGVTVPRRTRRELA
jgi:GNAT superfamily N-acetyltransferase